MNDLPPASEITEQKPVIEVKINQNDIEKSIRENKIFPHIPKINMCLAIVILILNIFLPGFGTMLLGCCLPKGFSEEKGIVCCSLVCIGILQFIFTVLIIGWIWSIAFGVIIVHTARQ